MGQGVLADREVGRRPDVGRFVVASLAAATAVLVAWQLRNDHVSSDRTTAVRAGHLLLDGGLNVYTVWPQAQMGPLALAVAGLLPTALFIVVVGGAAGLFVHLGYLATGARATPWHAVGAVLVGAAWQRWVFTGHADDVLVLVGLATLLVGVRRRSGWLAAAGLVLGLLGKPTAIVFVPLVWWVDRRSTGWALAAAAACWLPFFLVDPAGFLRAGEGIMSVRPGSLWGRLGVTGAYPHYVRPLQLILAWTAGLLLVRRSGPAAAALVAVVLRAALEPAPMPLYWMSVVAVAFLVDLPRRVSVVTAVAFLGFVLDLHDSRSVGAGLLRLALLLVVAVLGALLGQRTPPEET